MRKETGIRQRDSQQDRQRESERETEKVNQEQKHGGYLKPKRCQMAQRLPFSTQCENLWTADQSGSGSGTAHDPRNEGLLAGHGSPLRP